MDFRCFLQENIVCLDGGMGTLLQARGLRPGAPDQSCRHLCTSLKTVPYFLPHRIANPAEVVNKNRKKLSVLQIRKNMPSYRFRIAVQRLELFCKGESRMIYFYNTRDGKEGSEAWS